MISQAQGKAADVTCIAAWVFGACSFTVEDVLQIVVLLMGLATGAFSIYFHIQRFRRERKKD